MPVGEEGEYVDARAFVRRLRATTARAEGALWAELKGSKTGFKFRRQMEIDERTFVDFCCTSVKVIVELDGASHEGKEDQDRGRDDRLAGYGFLVLRFSNHEAFENTRGVVERIRNACEGRPRLRY
jgi:very-short-patch-repair endonuclease